VNIHGAHSYWKQGALGAAGVTDGLQLGRSVRAAATGLQRAGAHYPHCGYLRHQQKLTFDLLILKVVFESRVTWATFMPILVFPGLSVLELRPMYATDRRRTDVRQKHRLMPAPCEYDG